MRQWKSLLLLIVAVTLVGCSTGLSETDVDRRVQTALAEFQGALPVPLPTPTPVTFPPTPTPVTFPPTPTPVTFPPTPTAVVFPISGIEVPKDLTVERLKLVDSTGAVRAELSMIDGAPRLVFTDSTGVERIRLDSQDLFQEIVLNDEAGIKTVGLSSLSGNPAVTLRQGGTDQLFTSLKLAVKGGSPHISMMDAPGSFADLLTGDTHERLRIGLTHGTGNVSIIDANGDFVLSLLEYSDGGGGLSFWNPDLIHLGGFGVSENGLPALFLSDSFGTKRAFLVFLPNGEATLVFYDSAGKIIGLVP